MSTDQVSIPGSQTGDINDNNPSLVKATLAQKTPPVESPEATASRRWILFSFWAVALFIGLPVWVLTTTVPRASLPLQKMNEWANGQVGY